MKTLQFIAPNAAAALAQIHAQLGPTAVVLSVRPHRAHGVARLWHRNDGIEIVAGLPEGNDGSGSTPSLGSDSAAAFPGSTADDRGRFAPGAGGDRWQSVIWLQAMGLLPTNADRLQYQLNTAYTSLPASLDEEWAAVSSALRELWIAPQPLHDGLAPRPHVFIGPPGCGKTTVLCKWLTLAVLTEERAAHVWRLDGSSANTAEFLSIHCEMLGAPVERFWSTPDPRAELLFIDLPGMEPRDAPALAALRSQLAALPSPRIHLVLNAAYETSTLLDQWRAFSVLEPEDLTFTHLDEETRRVKLWNFVFGAHYGIRFLSAGQKIPGEFCTAGPALFFPNETVR